MEIEAAAGRVGGTGSAIRRRGGRLAAVASLLPRNARTGDIGSGHGILPRMLLASGRASFCIATERAGTTGRLGFPEGHPLGARLVVRRGDGLAPLVPADRLDSVVLAGMGARKMVRILGDDPRGVLRGVRLVLQPQSETGLLRRWLRSCGWRIVAESAAVERGRRYEVVAAERDPCWPALLYSRRTPTLSSEAP